MGANTLGNHFQLTTWGESHGSEIGGVIDGCPPGLKIDMDAVQRELDRRRPGQSNLVTPRDESDRVEFVSGVFNGSTTGAPIAFHIPNTNTKSEDYDHLKGIYRPGHADLTYDLKYGVRDPRGGGRASARTTASIVVGGAVAKQVLQSRGWEDLEVVSYVKSIYDVDSAVDLKKLRTEDVEKSIVRCPDPQASKMMEEAIRTAKDEGDSLGGVVECVIRRVEHVSGLMYGIGNPVFDKFDARLSYAMMNIPATKGVEIGSGFRATKMKGSDHNDQFEIMQERLSEGYSSIQSMKTKTNNAGGVIGGITTGEDVIFRVAFKPTSTIGKKQTTVNKNGESLTLEAHGRHDPCVLPRAVPIVDATAWLVLADMILGRI